MLFVFLTIVHIFVCLVLIAVILLQAGRGGGMSEMIGGGQPSSIFGTQTNAFMTRATEVCAVVFIITSLSLGILSTQKGKSLIEREKFARSLQAPVATTTEAAATVAPAAKAPEAVVPAEVVPATTNAAPAPATT